MCLITLRIGWQNKSPWFPRPGRQLTLIRFQFLNTYLKKNQPIKLTNNSLFDIFKTTTTTTIITSVTFYTLWTATTTAKNVTFYTLRTTTATTTTVLIDCVVFCFVIFFISFCYFLSLSLELQLQLRPFSCLCPKLNKIMNEIGYNSKITNIFIITTLLHKP